MQNVNLASIALIQIQTCSEIPILIFISSVFSETKPRFVDLFFPEILYSFKFFIDLFLCLFEKLWKRICAETTTELNLLLENWKYLLAGLIFQV